MKSNLFYSLFFIAVFIQLGNAQVGIGTTTPNAQFDIRSSNQATPSNTDGVLIPKIDVFPATNPTASQQGMLVYLTTATTFGGNPKPIGFYYWNNSPADWIGISSAANGDHDWYKVGTTLAPSAITDDMFHTGRVGIGQNLPSSKLEIQNVTTDLNSIVNSYTPTTDTTVNRTGINNAVFTSSTNDNVTGLYNSVSGTGTGIHYGISNQITSSNPTFIYGINNVVNSNSNTFGNNNFLTNNSALGTSSVTSYSSNLAGSSLGTIKGVDTSIGVSGSGNQYGVYNLLAGTGSSASNSHYGVYNLLNGTGTTNKYGVYNLITTTAGGTHYGIYSEVLKPGATNFAGYFLGNVGIGTTTANTYTMPASRGTNGQIMQTNGTGVVTWQNPSTALNSFAWLTTGNSGTSGGNTTTAGTNFIGTTDNQNLDIRTNNIYRARFSNLGEFFVGTLNTVITGDLMNSVSNATFPWAVNGYSDQNGSGIYGLISAGTTAYAAVQGETNSSAVTATGVRGLDLVNIAGTSFTNVRSGVNGSTIILGSNSSYKFGVYGNGGQATRSGGVMGNDFGFRGALGYFSSGATDYSVYGFGTAFTTGVAAGRFSSANHTNFSEKNTNIGLGIYGGVMGGWVRGMKYGFHAKGETYSLYVDGNAYTNKPLTYLIESDDNQRVASYMTTSIKPEVTINGKTALQNGRVFVAFDKNFSKVISNLEDIVITATPQGKSNGVYIDDISRDGFWIIENNDGVSNVKISWIAITQIKGEENPVVPSDLLAEDFDKKMDKVMFNDNNTTEEAQSLWWDGTKIRWDRPTNDKRDTTTQTLERPKDVKK